MARRYTITRQMCMTRDVGTHGNLFGGIMMSWLDEAGAIFTRLYTEQKHVVTVRVNELVFKHPVKVGQIVQFYAENPVTGKTSLTFDLLGIVEEVEVIRTSCTFVALDEQGRPRQITAKEERGG